MDGARPAGWGAVWGRIGHPAIKREAQVGRYPERGAEAGGDVVAQATQRYWFGPAHQVYKVGRSLDRCVWYVPTEFFRPRKHSPPRHRAGSMPSAPSPSSTSSGTSPCNSEVEFEHCSTETRLISLESAIWVPALAHPGFRGGLAAPMGFSTDFTNRPHFLGPRAHRPSSSFPSTGWRTSSDSFGATGHLHREPIKFFRRGGLCASGIRVAVERAEAAAQNFGAAQDDYPAAGLCGDLRSLGNGAGAVVPSAPGRSLARRPLSGRTAEYKRAG